MPVGLRVATIIFTRRSFHVLALPTIRDISFYLVALALLAFVVTRHDGEIQLWQPVGMVTSH